MIDPETLQELLEADLTDAVFESAQAAEDAGYFNDAIFYVGAPDTPPPTQLETVADVAARLKVTDRMVWKLLADGSLPSYAVGRARRIDAAAVNAYLGRRRV